MDTFLVWYFIGIIGAVLSRAAFSFGIGRTPPFIMKTIVVGAFFAFLGPVALAASVLWWVCAIFERSPVWEWKWVQPLRRAMNRELWPRS